LEKQNILKALGAVVYVVPTAAISNPNHYVNIARRLAEQARSQFDIPAAFMNQFENQANFYMHYHVTGPELYEQFQKQHHQSSSKQKEHYGLDAFVMSAGTGGTISGIAKYLKEKSTTTTTLSTKHHHDCRIVLVDPPGSSLFHKIKHGVAFAPQQREQVLKRHRYDTIAEGIGLDRVTHNLSMGLDCIDDAVQVSDQEAIDMAHYILQLEGLWIGSSSAMNLVGAVSTALDLEEGANVITVICDSGSRHVTRMWNREFVLDWGLTWPGDQEGGTIPDCLRRVYESVV
jgi:cysteine synthase A